MGYFSNAWRVGLQVHFFAIFQVTGMDGNYKKTCINVLEVLRNNKDSLMAVLEAFVYDPLLNWRLIDGKGKLKAGKVDPAI